jgi:predicted glycoside hydrolase/deacetylase ChbG (UPF0249 family)
MSILISFKECRKTLDSSVVQITALNEKSDEFKKQTGEYLQVMHQSSKEEIERKIKSQVDEFTQRNGDTIDRLDQISTQLQQLAQKVDSQNTKFQVIDDRLKTIESEALSTQREALSVQREFVKLQKNVNKKMQRLSLKLERANRMSDDSSNDDN